MINETVCTVKSKNNVAKSVFLGLLGSSALLIITAIIAPKLTGLIWSVAFCFVVATIYVYNRYVGSEYQYAITNDGGIPTFTVGLRVGNTAKILARIDLDSITELRRMSGKEYRAYKCEKGVMKYPYFPTMRGDEVYLVAMRSEYEKSDVFIEPSSEFAEALASYTVGCVSSENKE